MESMMTTAQVSVEEYEIEEHVAENNRFIKKTGFTLDDLHVYAEPWGDAIQLLNGTANRIAEGLTRPTDEEVLHAFWLAVNQQLAIDAVVEFENAA